MRTEILPGVSLHNKEWAEQMKQELDSHGILTTVIYWPYWELGVQEPGWIESEAQKIVDRGETTKTTTMEVMRKLKHFWAHSILQ